MAKSVLQYSDNVTAEILEYLFISEDAFRIFELAVNVIIFGALSIVGITSNVINIVIFVKLVIKDSTTLNFFALSFTDFAVAVVALSMSVTFLASELFPSSPVDLWALTYVCFGWSLNAGHLISCWITALISVERCFCVVSPFKVRRFFNRGRCAVVIVIIYVIHIETVIPVYIVEKMQWVSIDPPTNLLNSTETTRLYYTIIFSDGSDAMETALDITASLFLFLTSQIVLLVCSLWMAYSLKLSSSIRSHSSILDKKPTFLSNPRSLLTRQEKKLIKLVLTLSVMQTACNFPSVVVTVFFHTYPGLNVGAYKYISTIVWTTCSIFHHISCTMNTWCYYHLNSNYRKMFRLKFVEIFM